MKPRISAHANLRELRGSASMTPEDLREIFSYNAETGDLRWRQRVSRRFPVGAVVGALDRDGYMRVTIRGRHLKCHRIAWAIVHGRWPHDQIDHVDGNRANNAIANLREANNAQNNWNIHNRKLSVSGFRGVSWHERDQRWRASITVNARKITLGRFRTAEEASQAYLRAKSKFHGEFGVTSGPDAGAGAAPRSEPEFPLGEGAEA